MFDDTANFSGLFKKAPHQKISDVKHKVFLDVNEDGSEAAAATCKNSIDIENHKIINNCRLFSSSNIFSLVLEIGRERVPC